MQPDQTAFLRFAELLDARRIAHVRDRDIRQHVLSLAGRNVGFGLIAPTMETHFGANLRRLFPAARAVDQAGFADSAAFFATGTVFRDGTHSHKGALQLFEKIPPGGEVIFFEPAYLATTHSWAHSFRSHDPAMACLGYVYDDIAYYFMADYPNRLIQRLNGDMALTDDETARARCLIDRITRQKISKYNAQPMLAPAMTDGYKRRVLVCDQAYADASTLYGKVDDAAFERMLIAALRENPDAEVLVKTHPDSAWEKTKRSGFYSHLSATGRVRLLRDPVNPYALFDHVDTVYVGTSQMGLEALFAGKEVVCFGAPFYAGWGLTDDRQPIPHRHRRRSLEELFHAFYIWYSIYHVPGAAVPSQIEDVLDYIEAHRPYPLPATRAEVAAPPKVSVIIPVHGVAAFVAQCIASVQAQTLREIEIIPVNDASPDDSQAIIDRLAADDARIRPLILRDNQGQGFARNAALGVARGDYVWFLDGDDWLENRDLLQSVVDVAQANDSDMVRAKKLHEAVFSDTGTLLHTRRDPSEAYFDADIAATTFAETPALLHNRHHWTWLYRRAFLQGNAVRFVTPQWEERAFLTTALVRAKTISLTTVPACVYRVRHSSTARRRKTARDFAWMMQNFQASVTALLDAGAGDGMHPLRPHLNFTLSHFVHHMFIGEAYGHHCRAGPAARDAFLAEVRALFARAGFAPSDLVTDTVALRSDLVEAGAYPLIVGAVLAHRPDLIDAAIAHQPIAQDVLYKVALAPPDDPAIAALQGALNTYARNDMVRPSRARLAPWRKKPRVVVHIGTTKTGSTYLQTLMEQNRPALLRAGVWYPEVGLFWQRTRPHKQAGHSAFTGAAVRGTPDLRRHIEAGLALMKGRIHTIVLSSEAYFLHENAPQIARYFDGYPVEMVAYLRRQDEWANAQYCEFVAGGAVGRVDVPFDTWVATDQTRRRLDYAQKLAPWAETIGKSNMTIRVFEPDQLVDRDLVTDFAQAIGVPMLRDLPRPSRAQANASVLSAAHVELIRQINLRPFADRDAYFAFIEETTRAILAWRKSQGLEMPKPWVVPDATARHLTEAAAHSNAQVARDYLGRADGDLFRAPARTRPAGTLHAKEIEIVMRAYDRHRPAPVAEKPAPQVASQTVVRRKDYGLFGWRLWGLTPIVAVFYARQSTPDELRDFVQNPAAHARRYWIGARPILTRLLYPSG